MSLIEHATNDCQLISPMPLPFLYDEWVDKLYTANLWWRPMGYREVADFTIEITCQLALVVAHAVGIAAKVLTYFYIKASLHPCAVMGGALGTLLWLRRATRQSIFSV